MVDSGVFKDEIIETDVKENSACLQTIQLIKDCLLGG